ncbi:hypothetical protein BpHYR1_022244 [Brachionus plicatilis]|uniref:Uncharacterized protein n=1 Tax=Brachionus plicatilis TaxID=10195 RepID=A0A3M7T5F5_BRAPC|nr:hypothetical protein BpHYR1_022244 [Brachionus plicatilis]
MQQTNGSFNIFPIKAKICEIRLNEKKILNENFLKAVTLNNKKGKKNQIFHFKNLLGFDLNFSNTKYG